MRRLRARPDEPFGRWLTGTVLVPLVVATIALAGVFGVEDFKPVDCFHRDQQAVQIYDQNPELYNDLIRERDPLAEKCSSLPALLKDTHPGGKTP